MFCGTNSAVMPKYVSSIRYSINVAAEVFKKKTKKSKIETKYASWLTVDIVINVD